MAERYPGYDVMAKRHSPSWNEQTRRVIDQRIAVQREPRFLTEDEYLDLVSISDRITPQPRDRAPIPVAALIDNKLFRNRQDGYRAAEMPREREAWRRGLAALDAEAQQLYGKPFRRLDAASADGLLKRMADGDLHHAAWSGMPPKVFFKQRLLTDIVHAYWSHPTSWNEIGWGGPAGPRGYVRMGYDERDPWEPAEARKGAGNGEAAYRANRRVG